MEKYNVDYDQEYRIPFFEEERWKNYLKDNGFVVVADFISLENCKKYYQKVLDTIQELSLNKFDQNDRETWKLGKNFPFMLHGGMIQYMGHSQFQWDLREEASILFSKIWNVDQFELASSFDGFCFMSGERKYKPKPVNSFLHTDQSPLNTKLWSYQGLVNLVDCDSESGGFVCVPKSHLIHRKYFEDNHNLSDKKLKENWYLFSETEKEKNKILSETIKVNCKAGDFILWDSRTFHCNTTPNKPVIRSCVYICMVPKSKLDGKCIEKRKKAFETHRCTSHHPAEVKLFPVVPRFTQEPDKVKLIIKKICSETKLSLLQKSLACIE